VSRTARSPSLPNACICFCGPCMCLSVSLDSCMSNQGARLDPCVKTSGSILRAGSSPQPQRMAAPPASMAWARMDEAWCLTDGANEVDLSAGMVRQGRRPRRCWCSLGECSQEGCPTWFLSQRVCDPDRPGYICAEPLEPVPANGHQPAELGMAHRQRSTSLTSGTTGLFQALHHECPPPPRGPHIDPIGRQHPHIKVHHRATQFLPFVCRT
jgi:hypothetical protein